MAFAGFSLRRTTNQTIPGATNTGLVWDDPVLDALGWHQVGDPQYVAVPAGVAVAQFCAGVWTSASVNGAVILGIWQDGGPILTEVRSIGNAVHRIVAQTAPVPVVAGDRFRVIVWSTTANAAVAVPSTYFGGTVLATSLT